MKTLSMLSALLLCTILCKAQTTNGTASFADLLKQSGMTYEMPENVEEIPVKKTQSVPYSYAVKMKDRNVEIRYLLRPLTKEFFTAFESREKSNGDSVLHPNKIHRLLTPMIYSKISGGKLAAKDIQVEYFKPESIKKSTGAESGTMFTGPVGPEWGLGYNFGFFVSLHKDNTADANVFYLFEDEKQMADTFQEITSSSKLLYALKFK